jgi:hypothetical protein
VLQLIGFLLGEHELIAVFLGALERRDGRVGPIALQVRLTVGGARRVVFVRERRRRAQHGSQHRARNQC